jgi:peptide/nickel transport system substrate-binding protein
MQNSLPKALIVGPIALVVALVATSCTPASDGDDATASNQVVGDVNTVNSGDPVQGGTMTVAALTTIQNWNVLHATGSSGPAASVTNAIYPRVWNYEPDGSTISLNEDLMESVEVVSEDPTTIRYTINPDAAWSDGVPISTDDFVYSIETLSGRCAECLYDTTYGFENVESWEVSGDKKEITIRLEQNLGGWKMLYSQNLLPAHIAAENGTMAESFNTYFTETVPTVGGHAYMITDFDRDVSVTMEPNPHWYGDDPVPLDKLIFRMITDVGQVPAGLANNELQVAAPGASPDILETLKGMAGTGVVFQIADGYTYETITFNHSTTDPVVRQALATAIDREEIIERTVRGVNEKAAPLESVLLMTQQTGYESKAEELNHGLGDLEGALAIIDEAGYTIEDGVLLDADGNPTTTLDIVYPDGNVLLKESAAVITAAARELGVETTVSMTDNLGATMAEIDGYGYDLALVYYTATPLPAINGQNRWSTGGQNLHYSNPDYDRTITEAVHATDPQEEIRLINEADRLLLEDVYIYPLYQRPSLVAYWENVVNVRDNSQYRNGITYNVQDWGFTE